MDIVVAVLTGYLLGSIPFGLLASRLRGGVDLREYGSGKTGLTNSLRVLGLRGSLPVLIGDFLKGFLAALLPLLYTDEPWARALGGLAAVIGHVWPLFAGFRGGRGVLTGTGALMALSPIALLVILPISGLILYRWRFVSLMSISAACLAALSFCVFAALGFIPWPFAVAAVVGGALIVVLHHDNIDRLRAGTERKLGQRVEVGPATGTG